MPPQEEPHEKDPRVVRRQEWVAGFSHCIITVPAGGAKQSRVNSSGLASVNAFQQASGYWVSLDCLLPGPGVIKMEAHCLLGSAGQIEEVWLWTA